MSVPQGGTVICVAAQAFMPGRLPGMGPCGGTNKEVVRSIDHAWLSISE